MKSLIKKAKLIRKYSCLDFALIYLAKAELLKVPVVFTQFLQTIYNPIVQKKRNINFAVDDNETFVFNIAFFIADK